MVVEAPASDNHRRRIAGGAPAPAVCTGGLAIPFLANRPLSNNANIRAFYGNGKLFYRRRSSRSSNNSNNSSRGGG